MKEPRGKRELTDLEKADCKTGKSVGGIALKAPGWGSGKRRRFVFDDRTCCYHTMSRVAGGELLFGDVEKEAFRKLMRRMERFSGVEVLTYAVMGNHFHLLVRVPERRKFLRKFEKGTREQREARLFEHLGLLYSKAYLAQLKAELEIMTEKGMDSLYQKTVQGYLARLCSLEHFMKELKERFSRWFNKRHGRRGTLWQDRYKSVLVEDGEALRTMAAYIDLNPVRAGLVDDPKDYRWCGFAEAMGGSKRARRACCVILDATVVSWEATGRQAYRRLLLGEGMEAGEEVQASERRQGRTFRKRGVNRVKALAELREGKSLNKAELLRCRVRYFSDGLVLGSREFVERAFNAKREWFGAKRKTGARGLPVKEGGLFSLRDLKVQVLE
jgi:REP element-mobilizing transposase RayT